MFMQQQPPQQQGQQPMYYQGQPGGPAQPGSGQYMGAAPQMGYGTGPGALQPGAAFGGQQPQQIPPAGGFQQGMPPGGAAPPQGFSTAATQFGTGQPQLTAQQPTHSGGSLGQQPFPGSSAKPDSQDGVPPQPPAPVSNPMQTISSVPPQRPPPVKDSLEQRFQVSTVANFQDFKSNFLAAHSGRTADGDVHRQYPGVQCYFPVHDGTRDCQRFVHSHSQPCKHNACRGSSQT
ncbi:hypothetical protein AAVH_39351, partial [Aphelenchoides avenae]